MDHSEIYARIRNSSDRYRVIAKTTNELQSIKIGLSGSNTKHHFTIGLESSNIGYEMVVSSKRQTTVIKDLYKGIQMFIGQNKSNVANWDRLRNKQQFEITFPCTKEYPTCLHGARVSLSQTDYNTLNHDFFGVLHAIYGRETKLVRIKIIQLNDKSE